jgi:hypothetical protein
MNYTLLPIVACVITLTACKKTETPPAANSTAAPVSSTVSGEVFIRTNGGETVKLTGQEVLFYPEDVIANAYVKAKESAVSDAPPFDVEIEKGTKSAAEINGLIHKGIALTQSIDPELQSMHKKQMSDVLALKQAKEDWPSASYVFTYFPKPEQRTRTNSDGKFTITLPPGKWVAVAEASRQTGEKDQEEHYYWAVLLNSNPSVMLDNTNLVTTNSEESAIHLDLGYFKLK